MRKHKNKIIAGVMIAIVLAVVFWYGGDAPGLRGWKVQPKGGVDIAAENQPFTAQTPEVSTKPTEAKEEFQQAEQAVGGIPAEQADEAAPGEDRPQTADNTPMTPDEKEALAEQIAEESNASGVQNGSKEYSEENGMIFNESSGKDQYLTDPVPEGKPLPVEPQDVVISEKELTCTLSVRCDTILHNIAWLDQEKLDIVPEDGIIFAEKTVSFYEGESVFNLLMREMKLNKIHMEFENTPIYNSAYIEGIANLYEFDCGELSGWMYRVNGWFPNYGCSRYQLKAGDRVEWVYTCDLGIDVGGYYAAKGK